MPQRQETEYGTVDGEEIMENRLITLSSYSAICPCYSALCAAESLANYMGFNSDGRTRIRILRIGAEKSIGDVIK